MPGWNGGGEPNANYGGGGYFQVGMIPKLETMSLRLAKFIEKQGFVAVPMPDSGYWRHRPYKDVEMCHAGTFSQMHSFVAAGLGEFGWHGMAMSPIYGPRMRIVSVFTTAELDPDPMYSGPPLCDLCKLCAKHCPGQNFAEDNLLAPGYNEVRIGDKVYRTAKINRWRCFWGEQAHLDVTKLAAEKDLTEEGLYEAKKRGVQVIHDRGGSYMATCYKHCMSKPVRYFDRKYAPGPRRRKTKHETTARELLEKIRQIAKDYGVDRITVQPLANFADVTGGFPPNYRREEFMKAFSWVIAIGRKVPDLPAEKNAVVSNGTYLQGKAGIRIEMAVGAICRYIDDLGYEARKDDTDIRIRAAEAAGWDTSPAGNIRMMGLVCQAPLVETTETLEWAEPVPAGASPVVDAGLPFLKHIDKIGCVPIDRVTAENRIDVEKYLPGCRSLIVLVAGMPERTVELAGCQPAEDATSYMYLQEQLLRETLWAAHDLADWLTAAGKPSLPLADLAAISFPTLNKNPELFANAPFAVAAGVGELGLNGMLLTPEFGPRQRYAFVLTTADLESTVPYAGEKLCREGCRLCVDACPTQALNPDQTHECQVGANGSYPVACRDAVRCRWARLGMIGEVGPALLGWKTPDLPIPASLSEEDVEKALAQTDPILVNLWRDPGGVRVRTNVIVDRCLQACPVGK